MSCWFYLIDSIRSWNMIRSGFSKTIISCSTPVSRSMVTANLARSLVQQEVCRTTLTSDSTSSSSVPTHLRTMQQTQAQEISAFHWSIVIIAVNLWYINPHNLFLELEFSWRWEGWVDAIWFPCQTFIRWHDNGCVFLLCSNNPSQLLLRLGLELRIIHFQ